MHINMPGMEIHEHKQSEGTAEGRTAVTIEPERQQNIGVTTAAVAEGPAVATIRAQGVVAFDPDLAVAQREYVEALRMGDAGIVSAARQRLSLMGMGKDQIDLLSKTGKPDPNLTLPEKRAWIYASIYEREIPYVHAGQSATIALPDGKEIGTGTLRAIDTVLDPKTRTVRARIELENPGTSIKPNMFVTAILKNDLGQKLLVPKSAVIDSGTRKLVFVVHEGTHFMPRDVAVGPELADSFVVESGLAKGEVVATSALFLIDSRIKAEVCRGSDERAQA